jgi:hypothetical protein
VTHAQISGSRWQASTAEVRNWALNAGFETGADGSIPEQAITAYNQERYSKPHVIEKKKSPRAASNASS